MSERTRNTLFVLALAGMAVALMWLALSNPTEVDRVNRLGASIMCPVCQGESIASSPSDMARDMMAFIAERVAEGDSDREIVDSILASYSGALLLDPPVSGPTLVLWLAPLVALLAGVGVIIWWRRQPEPGPEPEPEPALPTGTRSKRRTAVGAMVMIASVAAVVMIVGFFLQERDPALGGLADIAAGSLEDYSNETMEAVIATYADDPQIEGMRLVLAERYVRINDYRSAFPHFFAVANSTHANDDQLVQALLGLAWMAWDGNQETQAALGLLDQALAIDPDSVIARYLKGRVLWCGSGEVTDAADLLTAILEEPDLPEETRSVVAADQAAILNGEACR